MRRAIALEVLAAATLFVPASAQEEPAGAGEPLPSWTPLARESASLPAGPLELPSQAPIANFRLRMLPRGVELAAEGQTRVRWSETWTNVWNHDAFAAFLLDYGALESRLAVEHGVGERTSLELALVDFRRFDSELDGLTDVFHDLFRISDNDRDLFEGGDNVVYVSSAPGREGFRAEDEDPYLVDLELALHHRLRAADDRGVALSCSLAARTNLAGDLPIGGGSDLSLAFTLRIQQQLHERWHAFANLGFLWHGRSRWRTIPLDSTQGSALFGLEYRYREDRALVAQYMLTEGATRGLSPYDDPIQEGVLGWRARLGPATVLELGILENIHEHDNSADIGFHLALRCSR